MGGEEVMGRRRLKFGSWDILWHAAAFIFLCILLFSILVGILIYLVCCHYIGAEPIRAWSGMVDIQRKVIEITSAGIFLFAFFLTILLTALYEKIILVPVKELLEEVERSSGYSGLSAHPEKYLPGGGLSRYDLFNPRESWADRVHECIEKAEQERYLDETTGCYNRKYFDQAIIDILSTQLLCQISRHGRPETSFSYGIYLLDIDNFKQINDKYGHACGDTVLSLVGNTLRELVDQDGIVIRHGGEEFLIIVSLGFPLNLSSYAERIRKEFCEKVVLFDIAFPEKRQVTCSLGFVPFPLFKENSTAVSVAQHVNLADQAMYMAKNAGRNTWRGIMPRSFPDSRTEFEQTILSLEYGARSGYLKIEVPNASVS